MLRRNSRKAVIVCLTHLVLACRPDDRLPSGPPDANEGRERELVNHARALHQRITTIDSHSDFPLESCGQTDLQVDLPKMRSGGLDVVFDVVYTRQREPNDSTYAEAKEQALEGFRQIHDAVRRCEDQAGVARTPEEVERIVASGKLAVVIAIENGFVIGRDLSLVRSYRDLGAAYIGLTHDGHNDIADSASPIEALGDRISRHGGVSVFGREVLTEMNRLGVMVDVSHMSRAATLDAVRFSRAPVLASHSSLQAIVPTPRNMTDETLLALAAKGGVIQITAVHSFIKVDPPGAAEAFSALLHEFDLETDADARDLPPDRRAQFEARLQAQERRWALATVGHMVDHIDYAVGLVGIDHVGIGSDFEGGGKLTGWADASESMNVTKELLRRGYTEEEIRKIWGGNLLRVWREVRRRAAGED